MRPGLLRAGVNLPLDVPCARHHSYDRPGQFYVTFFDLSGNNKPFVAGPEFARVTEYKVGSSPVGFSSRLLVWIPHLETLTLAAGVTDGTKVIAGVNVSFKSPSGTVPIPWSGWPGYNILTYENLGGPPQPPPPPPPPPPPSPSPPVRAIMYTVTTTFAFGEGSTYGLADHTYNGARAYCIRKGHKGLCPYDVVCPRGEGYQPTPSVGWFYSSDSTNQYVAILPKTTRDVTGWVEGTTKNAGGVPQCGYTPDYSASHRNKQTQGGAYKSRSNRVAACCN